MNLCIGCEIPIEASNKEMCDECQRKYDAWESDNQGYVEVDYQPTQEDEELMRKDMCDPALFGELAIPPEDEEQDLPEDFCF